MPRIIVYSTGYMEGKRNTDQQLVSKGIDFRDHMASVADREVINLKLFDIEVRE